MPHSHVNGINIYYEKHGRGEPLILISGLGGDHTFWQPDIDMLSIRYQVIVFDTRGIGKTDAPEAPYSMDMFADDLAALMDALQLGKAHILGFSMGGNIALSFALKYPERVAKLIIAASFAVINLQARLFIDAVLSVYEGGASAKQMFDLIVPWLFSPTFLGHPAHAAWLQYDEAEPGQQPLYAWKNQYLAQRQFNATARLKDIQAPALIIAAAGDRLAHPEDATVLAAGIPGAILKIIPEAGHLMNYEQPGLFHQHIHLFLNA